MSFINKLRSFFDTKAVFKIDVFSPCDGELVEQKDIPDEGFSEGHMGIGLGIKPTGTKVVAPITGKLVVLFKTKHAYVIKDLKSGISVMLHLGINTVNIPEDKKAFTTNLSQEDDVVVNNILCEMNLEVIRAEATSDISALLVQTENMENKKIVFQRTTGSVKAGDLLFSILDK